MEKIKRITITGCSSGFGRIMAYRFANKGWQVLATTRHPELLQQANNLHILPADIAHSQGRANIAGFIADRWNGKLDCLINNAGYGLAGPLEMLTEEQIRQQIEVNLFSPLLLTQDLLPFLREAKGRIINISSALGYTGMPLQSLYSASKFAIEGWSESLYYELAPHGVQVTLVEPGGFRTGFAQHMEWPVENSSQVSLYEHQLSGFRDFFTRLSQRGKGKNPERVIDTVINLANRPIMPLRMRVGQDAHALYYMRCIFPQRFVDRLLLRISKRLLGI